MANHSDVQIKSGSSKFLVILLIIAVFAIGMLWQKNQTLKKAKTAAPAKVAEGQIAAGTQQEQQKPEVTIDKIKELFSKDYIAFGDNKRKVLFVDFSDPSCPYCHVATGNSPELNDQIGAQFKLDTEGGTYVPPVREMKKLVDSGTASYVYLYRNGHNNGQLAAQALYCAYEKGKFWETHGKLMSGDGYKLINETVRNDKVNIPQLVQFLSGAVDSSFLADCLNRDTYADKLTRDIAVGDGFGVGGTPGFFVNTTNFAGAYSFTDMKPIVDEAI